MPASWPACSGVRSGLVLRATAASESTNRIGRYCDTDLYDCAKILSINCAPGVRKEHEDLNVASPLEVQNAILNGSTAFGWSYKGTGKVDLEQVPLRGYVRRHEEGHIEFEALDENPIEEGPLLLNAEAPPMLVLSTPHGAAILLDVHPQTGGSFNFGGGSASVVRFRADSVASGIDIYEIKTARMKSLALRFPGFGGWAGMNSFTRPTTASARHGGATLELRPTRREVSKRSLHSSLALSVEGYWDFVDSGPSAVTVHTGLDVEVSAVRARAFGQFIEPLLDFQDLLSLVNRGFVASAPAPTGLLGVGGGSPLLWNRRAMYTPKGAILASGRPRPLVSLADLGGVAGLARWSNLRRDHRVVVDTVSTPYRNGPDTIETAIIRVGSAIELWVAAHRRVAAWAEKGRSKSFAEALALHVGGPFEKWVGSTANWAEQFTLHYNGTKHHTPHVIDPEALRAFATTGRWLLVCALLNRIAGTKQPSRSILNSYQLEHTGESVRQVLSRI